MALSAGHPKRTAARRRAATKVPPGMLRRLGVSHSRNTNLWRNFLIAALVLTFLLPALALGVGGVVYANTAASLRPRLDKLASYHERAFQTSRIFDRNGQLLYEFVNAGRRDPVPLAQVAQVLKDATVSVEDKTFYENVGVDYTGIARAIFQNYFQNGEEVSGASTITQQVIRGIVLTPEERARDNRYRRKLTEIILAQEIGDSYSKDQILELYLNEINYGNLYYGIQTASQGYFGVRAKDLNLNQASLLAGLPQLPTQYNPILYLEDGRILKGVRLKTGWLNPAFHLPADITAPRARQVEVLRQMVLNHKIPEREARATIAQDLPFVSQDVAIHAPHFVFYVKQALENDPILGPLLINEGGLNITTTLDLRVQDLAQREAAKRIDELEKEKRNIHNAAVVVMRPNSGQILAMVGSIDYYKTKATTTPGEQGNVLDGNVNVTTRLRQPGSALKPFTYLSALEQGKLDAGSMLWDVETVFPINAGASLKNVRNPEFWYGPKNFDQKWHGPVRMRESLANSLNMPAVKALKRAGVPETLDLLHRVGIHGLTQPPDYYGLALTLGGGEVTPLDLTTAYSTLANNGEYIPSTPILQITDRAGNTLPYRAGEARQAVDPKYVAIIRDFMGDNDARTPMFGRNNALKLSRPSHAKTGTTEDFRDAWAVGYTPYVTVGVWTGNNNNEKTAQVESVVGGGVIWNRIMEDLFKDPDLDRLLRGPSLEMPLDFPSPADFGLEQRKVCQFGGAFGQRTWEWFVRGQGNANRVNCGLNQTILAVRESNGAFCAPIKGVNYGANLLTIKLNGVPPSSEDELVIDPRWVGSIKQNLPIVSSPTRKCGEGDVVVPVADESASFFQPEGPSDGAQPTPGTVEAPPSAQEPPSNIEQPVPTQAPDQGPQQPLPTVPIQAPKPEPTRAPPPPKPAATMPSLVGLGENQAKGVLANLGITNVIVDYQGKDRLGALYDTYPAYVVVSHSPGAGAPISAGMQVVLGIRAP